MKQPNKINAELARILSLRIKKLVKKARHYPSKVFIHRDTAKVLAPYLEPQPRPAASECCTVAGVECQRGINKSRCPSKEKSCT